MWQRALVPLQVNDNSCHVLSPSPEAIFLFLVETCERSKKAPASAGRWNPALLQKAVNRRTHSGDLNMVLMINKAKLLFWNLVWKTESISSTSFFFFFWLGKVVLGNLSAARSLFSLWRAVAQNFMSAHPTVIEICRCSTEWWTDTETQPSPQLRAWQGTSQTWMPISCLVPLSPSLPASFSFVCCSPSAGSVPLCLHLQTGSDLW